MRRNGNVSYRVKKASRAPSDYATSAANGFMGGDEVTHESVKAVDVDSTSFVEHVNDDLP